MSVDARITLLENTLKIRRELSVPGTVLQRVATSISFLQSHGISADESSIGGSVVCWCLMLGSMTYHKPYQFYGVTIEDCLSRAEEQILTHSTKKSNSNSVGRSLQKRNKR